MAGTSKKSKPSDADKEAARRLRIIWERTRTERKITQADIIEGWGADVTQGAISQWLSGLTALNFLSVLRFARILGCKPEEIRSDMPEQTELKQRTGGWPFERITPNQWFNELDQFDRHVAERKALDYIDQQKGDHSETPRSEIKRKFPRAR